MLEGPDERQLQPADSHRIAHILGAPAARIDNDLGGTIAAKHLPDADFSNFRGGNRTITNNRFSGVQSA